MLLLEGSYISHAVGVLAPHNAARLPGWQLPAHACYALSHSPQESVVQPLTGSLRHDPASQDAGGRGEEGEGGVKEQQQPRTKGRRQKFRAPEAVVD